MNWYKQSKSQTLYHVTYTDKIPKILQEGIKPLQTSNWVSGTGERYGQGEIFAMSNLKDAIRWGAKMEWEFYQTMGSGKITIIEFKQTDKWDIDKSDPVSQLGNKGQWLKQFGKVEPEDIIKTIPLTIEMIKSITK